MKHWFRPDMALSGIEDIPLSSLKARGIDCLILDLDNTLAPWDDRMVTPVCRKFIADARAAGLYPVILSNNKPERVADFAAAADVDFEAQARKPLPMRFRRICKRLGYIPAQCAVAGDQLLTDILGGNLSDMTTILLNPFCDKEWSGTRINRFLERVVMKLFGIKRHEEDI